MALPVRNLPLVQRWDCQSCSHCCRIEAAVRDEEKQRIEGLDLAGDDSVAAGPWFVRKGGQWVLRHRPDGSCVFLTAENRCRLHERFGAAAKPFVCRLFPFMLIPAGNHWRVGMRYSCPSVAANQGRRLSEYEGDLTHLSHLLEKHVGRAGETAEPPPLTPGQQLVWPDLLRIVQALVDIVSDRSHRLERRLRVCLAVAHLCRQAQLDKLTGGKLAEFLKVIRIGLEPEVPLAADLPAPSWIGRVLFRTLLAIYARRDMGLYVGPATRTALGRVRSGWRYVRGRGPVPRVNDLLADITFESVESRTALPVAIDETLERYYVVKLSSLQFCGPPNCNLPVWAGLEALVLTLPIIFWFARALAPLEPTTAVQQAIMLVDDHFGGNPLLGSALVRYFHRTLSSRGEIERLVAWHSR
jgi:lysine-N-methylase